MLHVFYAVLDATILLSVIVTSAVALRQELRKENHDS